jgi:hypothetical protein
MRYLFFFLFIISLSTYAQVTVEKTNLSWNLLMDGEPFEIKGATFGYGKDLENYDAYFKDLKFLGVNTIRTWAIGENTALLLDTAHNYGIKVMLGIWMRHGRPGMEDDDSFDYLTDTKGMEAMRANAITTVETYKDHPAILTWGIGNEVYLNMDTDEEKVVYSKLLERICSDIKSIDSNHPITSVEAWTFGLEWWQKYVPSLDIYGLNSYGSGANYLSAELEKRNIDKPYILTEFGVTGEWDIKEERNGIIIEPSDQQKYDAIAKGYEDWIKPKLNCLGVYVFHYSSSNDFGAIWLLTHFNSMCRPQYWAIRKAYTGEQPLNNVPIIETFGLPNSKYDCETWVPVKLKTFDVENEKIDISFHYNQRTGSRKRRNQINKLNYRGNLADGFEIQLPQEDGAIKIYVNVKDTYNNVGIASGSIIVNSKKAKKKKYLVPKASLPFYVYQDKGDLPYVPSGYMGNYRSMDVDLGYKKDKYSGETCLKIGYEVGYDWYGLALVDPSNDWGKILGGYDISEAKTFSFWAKTNVDNVNAKIGFGLITEDQPFPDTAIKHIEIRLTKDWKKYTIKTKRFDLSCIRSGFVLFSGANGFPHEIYIDDVVFE